MPRPIYKRNPETDPHLPHTTEFRNRDIEHLIPPEAKAVIDKQWPEVVRTFQQYDKTSGMLMLFGTVRDACKAAGWPDSMAYQMRDYLIAKLNGEKVKTYNGSDERMGDWETFNMKERLPESLASTLLEDGDLITVTNQHNGQQYKARIMHWPEHGWHAQILDLGPEVWGRSLSGEGSGPVIDQGWQKELEQRGWQFPEMKPPVNIRDQEMKRLAQSFAPKPATPKQGDLFQKESRSYRMAENKFLKKAINPEHKGYCTPMSKKTCTPARKALAKRFKSGDLHHESAQRLVARLLEEEIPGDHMHTPSTQGGYDTQHLHRKIRDLMAGGMTYEQAKEKALEVPPAMHAISSSMARPAGI